ncbi:uncharacterized protein LOC127830933 isoform X2 [Dreissena polymorpha]|nr:uncharacterized protein LOC127830933 isoform X2 [Dreissena polymorpha]
MIRTEVLSIGNKQSEMVETDHRGRSDCKQCQSVDEPLRMMKGIIISSFISILILILILIGIFFRRQLLKGNVQRIIRTKSPKSIVNIVNINTEYTDDTEGVPMITVDNTFAHEDTLSMKDAPKEVALVTGFTPLGENNGTLDSGESGFGSNVQAWFYR